MYFDLMFKTVVPHETCGRVRSVEVLYKLTLNKYCSQMILMVVQTYKISQNPYLGKTTIQTNLSQIEVNFCIT